MLKIISGQLLLWSKPEVSKHTVVSCRFWDPWSVNNPVLQVTYIFIIVYFPPAGHCRCMASSLTTILWGRCRKPELRGVQKTRPGTSLAVQWLRLHLPMQEVQVWSLVGGAKIPHASRPKNQNIKQKQYCNKFNKDFKKMVHIKKILKQKKCSSNVKIPPKSQTSVFPFISWKMGQDPSTPVSYTHLTLPTSLRV